MVDPCVRHVFYELELTIQAVWYTADLLCFLDPTRRAHYLLFLVWWWPTLMTVVSVFILVQLVIVNNSLLFDEAAKQYGIGDMILGHELVHIVPVFVIMLFGMTRGNEIKASISMLKDSKGHYGIRLPLYTAINYFYPILIVFAYVVVNNYLKVYHVNINPALALGAVFILYTLLFVLSLWWVFPRETEYRPDDNIKIVMLQHDIK
jgi:hypothetical protein